MAVIKPAISFVPAYSGNYAKGRSIPIQRIILHWIVGEISASDAVFTKKQAIPRSAHYAVGSVGEIHQYVSEKDTAWHAGNANAGSIGIEHAGGQLINGIRKTPTQSCHDSSARLVAWLCQTYKIPCNSTYIRGHSSYMQTQCPGTLNMSYIIKKANEIISNYNPPPMATIPDSVYKSAKIGFDDLFAFFKVHGIRGDLDTFVKQGGDSVEWSLFYGAKNNEFRGMYDALIKERNALKAELANLNSPTNIVKALDRLNETIKNKP